jgi:BioD-like phosphotransacetylase family protein
MQDRKFNAIANPGFRFRLRNICFQKNISELWRFLQIRVYVAETLKIHYKVLHWSNSTMLLKGILEQKTSTKIAEDFNAKAVLERFADNPFCKVL